MVSRCGLLFAWELCSFAMLLPSGICGPMVAMLNAGSATPPREMAKKLGLLRLLPAGCGACICGNCWLLVIMLVMSAVIFTMTRKRRGRMLFSKHLLPVVYMNAVMCCKAASINSLSTSCGARKTHSVLEQLQVLQASLRTSIRNTTKTNSLKRRLARPVDKTCVGT
jgi:hypothetical protein